MVKTNRSFVAFLLLSIITCGIYSLFFWHSYVKDVNTICAGDGKNTRGVLAMILLSIITCGIYGIVWTYGMQKRLSENAARYNAGVIAGGGTVLLWSIVGAFFFGIGTFVATYIQIDSLNRLAYNYTAGHNRAAYAYSNHSSF